MAALAMPSQIRQPVSRLGTGRVIALARHRPRHTRSGAVVVDPREAVPEGQRAVGHRVDGVCHGRAGRRRRDQDPGRARRFDEPVVRQPRRQDTAEELARGLAGADDVGLGRAIAVRIHSNRVDDAGVRKPHRRGHANHAQVVASGTGIGAGNARDLSSTLDRPRSHRRQREPTGARLRQPGSHGVHPVADQLDRRPGRDGRQPVMSAARSESRMRRLACAK